MHMPHTLYVRALADPSLGIEGVRKHKRRTPVISPPPRDLMTMCGAKGRHPISAATETPLAQVASAGVPLILPAATRSARKESAREERRRRGR